MKAEALQVLGGLFASGAIFLVMFVVILGPLMGYVIANDSALLWVGIVYVPYLVVGLVSIVKNLRAFGSTLIITGLVCAIFFYGFVNGLGGSF
jgi:hypothetical protein